MVKVEWAESVGKDVHVALKPYLDKWGWVVPTWCHVITVEYGATEDGDDIMAIGMQPEYRQATLQVCPAWMAEARDGRERALVHELVHLLLAPLTEFHDDLLTRMRNGVLRGWAEEQHRRAFEGAVVDMAAALLAVKQK